MVRLGAEEWRHGWATRRPGAPRWFVDDRTDYSAGLGHIECPTLIVLGTADPLSTTAVGAHLVSRLRSARVFEVIGATHELLEERAPEIARELLRHIRGA